MNKKISLGWVVCVILLTITVTFLVTWQISEDQINKSLTSAKSSDSVLKKVSEIESLISQYSISDVKSEQIADFAAKGISTFLDDKYSAYYSAEEYKKNIIESSGKFTGIGISIKIKTGESITITDVYENSPAKEAGLSVGDAIIKVAGKNVSDMTSEEISSATLGELGETFDFVVLRDKKEIPFSIVRTQFERVYVSHRMLGDNIGYIRISQFEEKTPEQFKSAMDELIKNGAVAFIFDVRNNPGGELNSILSVLDPLLPEGVIATAVGKDGKSKTLGESDKNELEYPSAILVNSNTASAAELFCAAMKDYDKAEIVGNNTFGKGIMQETFVLSDGSAVKFTTAKYFSPKGTNYDGVGIAPDYTVDMTVEEQELVFAKSDEDDAQIQTAIDVILNKLS